MRRKLLVAVGIVLAIAVLLAIALPYLIDVETYHGAIESALASATGRKVTIGPMKLRILPAPDLTAAGITIGEDPSFGAEPFLKADHLEVRIQLMPLLARRISVSSLAIQSPNVRLHRNAKGAWNFASLLAGSAEKAKAGQREARPGGPNEPPAQKGTEVATPEGTTTKISVDRLDIENGKLVFRDEAATTGRGPSTEVRDVDLKLTDLSATSPVGIDLAFDMAGLGKGSVAGKVGPYAQSDGGTLPFDLHAGIGGGDATLSGRMTGMNERSAIDARIRTEKTELKRVAPLLKLLGPLYPSGLAMKGEILLDATARGPLDDPSRISVEGTADVTGLEYVDASIAQPITGIGGKLVFRGDHAEITGFSATLGKSSVKGACTISRFAQPILDVRLDSPLLDVDDLLAMMSAAPGARADASGTAAGDAVAHAREDSAPAAPGEAGGAKKAAATAQQEPSALRDVTLRGDLAVSQAKAMNLSLSGAKGRVDMQDGEARLSDIAVQLYGGTLGGSLTAGLADPGPPFTLDGRLQRVDFDALAGDFSKDLKGLVTGALETDLQVQGRGLDSPSLRKNLTGKGSLALRDGKLKSFGVLKQLAKVLQAAGGKGIGEEETPFKSLTGTFQIAGGKAVTDDLELSSDDIDLAAKGSIGLDLGLDLDISAMIAPAVSADMVAKTPNLKYLLDSQQRLVIDCHAGGTLAAPSIGVDPDMLKRAARSGLKEKVREKGKSLLEKLLEKKKEKKP